MSPGPVSLRQALLAPRSVALIGASDDPSKNAGRPLPYLRQAGFGGTIYPINPRRETVQGERAWPSLDALPETPDQAYILTPTDAAIDAVEDCGRAGVTVATVLADGFAGTDARTVARAERLREISQRTGV